MKTIDNKEKSNESQSTPTKRDADVTEPSGSESKKRKIGQTQSIINKIKRSSPKKESQSVFA
jgi:hypothetical protein